ncbi:MAG: hypothetical protein ACOXZI_01195 [Candidatus Cryptobacteroides sp.]
MGQEQRSRGKKVEAGAERRGSGRARSKEARGLGMLRRRKGGKNLRKRSFVKSVSSGGKFLRDNFFEVNFFEIISSR